MKLPISIERQVPEFVRESHPAFIEFLKAYYEWYETEYSIGKLSTLLDIDTTIDDFVQHFRKQLDSVSVLNKIDNKLYLKHIKELYASKGSSAAYKFLFRILFDKQSEVIVPWDSVFKASGGTWAQQTSVLVDFDGAIPAYDPLELINDTVYITDEFYARYSVFVNDVVKRTDTIYEVFVERFAPRSYTFTLVQTRDGLISGTPVLTPTRVKISNGGSKFEVGEVQQISNGDGTGVVTKIKSVSATGAITAIDIIEFGLDYSDDFAVDVSPFNATGDDATLSFTLGYLLKYPGYYTSSQSIVGDAAYIQDSYYHQVYSYVTALEETLDSYSLVLKKILHPSGMKHFATYQINNLLSPTLSVTPSLNIISRADAFRDFVYFTDLETNDVYKSLADVFSSTDILTRVVDYVRSPEYNPDELIDIVNPTEYWTHLINKALSDTVETSDTILIEPGIGASETITTSEVIEKTLDKYINDSVAMSTSGAVYGDPVYVDVLDTIYWQPGYLDTERVITN